MNRTKSGMTLIEVMASLSVLSIALLGVIAVVSTVMRLNDLTRGMTLAMEGARQQMEQVQSLTFADIPTTYQDSNFDVAGLRATDDDPDGMVGKVRIDATNPDFIELRVEVVWRTPTGPRYLQLKQALVDQRVGSSWGEKKAFSAADLADSAAEEGAPGGA